MIESPLMLVGAERSGTTLLRLMLDHHPEIALLPEFEFSVELVGAEGQWPEIAAFHDLLRTSRDFLEYELSIDPALDYPTLVDSFLAQKRDRDGKGIVGATVHHHFDRLTHLWPAVRFIHIVRDGRDVAASAIPMGWAGNTYTGVERWIDAEELWESIEARVPESRRIDVYYEELVADPKLTVTKICEFIGVEFDDAMFDYARTSSYSAPDGRLAAQWKRKQSEWEVRLTESRIATMLARRGYEPSGFPSLVVEQRLERSLLRQDRWARRRFRARAYGWRLFLEDILSRHLGVRGWQESVRLRQNALDASVLK